MSSEPVMRVAFVAGTLGQGGAEKQLVYAARALCAAGAAVRVYCLTRGEHHEASLRAGNIDPIWIGRLAHPLLRLGALARRLASFRPHVIQSTHAYANLYVALAGRALRVPSLGALRNSLQLSQDATGRWTPWLLSAPHALVANSEVVRRDLIARRVLPADRVWVVPNVLELSDYPTRAAHQKGERPTAILVARLIALKRVDVFLRALAHNRDAEIPIRGVIVGDGPERVALERLASDLKLGPHDVTFLGARDDVPALLASATMLVLTSDDEGSPNVVLEAMAAGLPVITTPAGEAPLVVADGVTGFHVPFGDPRAVAARMATLAGSPERAADMGAAGRHIAETRYSCDRLADQWLAIYHAVARRVGSRSLLRALARHATSHPLGSALRASESVPPCAHTP